MPTGILCVGTWQIPIDQVDKIVAYAILEAGYRHIDCAWMYGNEEGVGKGIKAALDSGKVKREELFVRRVSYIKQQSGIDYRVE